MELLFKKISEWAAGEFGADRDPINIALKLRQEVDELSKEVKGYVERHNGIGAAYDELADVIILSMNLADRLRLDYDGLRMVVKAKLRENMGREWVKMGDGTFQHKENSNLPAHRCTLCEVNWVDSDSGFDTCQECLMKM